MAPVKGGAQCVRQGVKCVKCVVFFSFGAVFGVVLGVFLGGGCGWGSLCLDRSLAMSWVKGDIRGRGFLVSVRKHLDIFR